MLLEIVSQEEQLFNAEVEQVSLPAAKGEITVLPGHEPLMSTLIAGEVTIGTGPKAQRLVVSPGFVQVVNDKITVLVDSAVREDALDEQKAEEARRAAEQAMADSMSQTEVAMTLGMIERSIAEMQAIRKRKHSTGH